MIQAIEKLHGERERGREGGREAGRERAREGGREGGRERSKNIPTSEIKLLKIFTSYSSY